MTRAMAHRIYRESRRLAGTAATVLSCTALGQTVSVSLSGEEAEGYFATIGLNQEGNQTLAGISRNPADPKFFDYPAYINPLIPTNVYIMYVEPYRFGLPYPDPLHPVGFNAFEPVGTLRPAAEAGQPGVTFIEGVTEDTDFTQTNIGALEFDASLVNGAGTEVVAPGNLTFVLDGAEFQSTNRTEIIPGADVPPFGPEGRSNRNEAANTVTISIANLTGTGLTFRGGLLTSIDISGDASVSSVNAAVAGSNLAFDATGMFEITGRRFAFDIDGQDSTPFASDVRVILNRAGSISAVGAWVAPGACPADFNGDGTPDETDVAEVLALIDAGSFDYDASGHTDFFDALAFLRVYDGGCE